MTAADHVRLAGLKAAWFLFQHRSWGRGRW